MPLYIKSDRVCKSNPRKRTLGKKRTKKRANKAMGYRGGAERVGEGGRKAKKKRKR